MPIGFWSISRKDIESLADFTFKQRYGRLPQHNPNYHETINRIVRRLPDRLSSVLNDVIEDTVIEARAAGMLPAEGKVY